MKFKITAVVPVAQYANLQPSIEVEADTYEEAKSMAMPHIESFWNQYGEKPLTKKTISFSNTIIGIRAFVGGVINYDPVAHTYTNDAGEVYLSGSQYAKQFDKPFDTHKISEAVAKRDGKDGQDIRDEWKLNGEVSMGFGTAIHAALELYGKYGKLHDHPIIKKAVQEFYDAHPEKAEYEPMIVDHKAKRAGQVDRLEILGDKHARVTDYKTNAVMSKDKLKTYWAQLDFYVSIMQAAGWKMEEPVIYHWDGSWHTITKEEN